MYFLLLFEIKDVILSARTKNNSNTLKSIRIMKNLEQEREQMTDNYVDHILADIFGKPYQDIENIEDNDEMNEVYEYLTEKIGDALRNLPVSTSTKINILMKHLHRNVDMPFGCLFVHLENDLSNIHLVTSIEYHEQHQTFLRYADGGYCLLNDLTEDEIETLYRILLMFT